MPMLLVSICEMQPVCILLRSIIASTSYIFPVSAIIVKTIGGIDISNPLCSCPLLK